MKSRLLVAVFGVAACALVSGCGSATARKLEGKWEAKLPAVAEAKEADAILKALADQTVKLEFQKDGKLQATAGSEKLPEGKWSVVQESGDSATIKIETAQVDAAAKDSGDVGKQPDDGEPSKQVIEKMEIAFDGNDKFTVTSDGQKVVYTRVKK